VNVGYVEVARSRNTRGWWLRMRVTHVRKEKGCEENKGKGGLSRIWFIDFLIFFQEFIDLIVS
jgi:hypothetical protein